MKLMPKASDWKELKIPAANDEDVVVTEFDAFKDFIAVYCTRNGKPEVMIRDLEKEEFITGFRVGEVG